MINRLARASRRLQQLLGRDPTPAELADEVGLPLEKVLAILKTSMEPISLEMPVGQEDDSHLGDFIEDQKIREPDDEASRKLLREQLRQVLDSLSEREREVLSMRFGLQDGHIPHPGRSGAGLRCDPRAHPPDRGQGPAQAAPPDAEQETAGLSGNVSSRSSNSSGLQFLPECDMMSLVFLAPAEALWMNLKVAFIAALIVSLPIIFYQVWKFIAPGLLPREKKYFIPFMISASALFSLGALFCFFVVLPLAMTFLLGYKSETLTPMLSVGSYIDFCLKFILAFGAIFELPLVIIFLTRFGFVTPAALARKRKYAVLAAFILAAMLTPTPDAFNQILMAIPIIVLYDVGIVLSRILHRGGENG